MARIIISILLILFSFQSQGQIAMFHAHNRPPAIAPLLDVYGSARAAYSTRLLRTAYAGSCMRVRRSSDNTQQDIGFTGGVLDEASLLSFTGGGSGFVVTWYDQSGNGNNATQATQANQMRIVNSGVVEKINGKASPRAVDNTDHFTATFSMGNPASYFVVSQNTAITGFHIFDNSSGGRHIVGYIPTDAFVIFAGTVLTHGTTGYANRYALYTAILNGGSSIAAFNGSNVSGNAGTGTTSGNVTINKGLGTNGNTGYFQEIIVYNSNQTSNQAGIQSNINSYYLIY